MNRQIDFRCWCPKKNKMFYSEQGLSGANGFVTVAEVYTGYSDQSEWVHYVFMQFTGLFDENRVKIFEGDIVKDFEDKYEVRFGWLRHGSGYGFYLSSPKMGGSSQMVLPEILKVIGNIFESPELLEDK